MFDTDSVHDMGSSQRCDGLEEFPDSPVQKYKVVLDVDVVVHVFLEGSEGACKCAFLVRRSFRFVFGYFALIKCVISTLGSPPNTGYDLSPPAGRNWVAENLIALAN
jgi:hypothetical protein